MSRPLEDMPPDEVLREVFAERRRRECPPSLAGIEPDQPKERKPASGRYESLLLLTMGCDRLMVEAMYEVSAMYQLATWQCPAPNCQQVVLHEHRPVLGDDGHPLMSQGQEITEAVTVPVHASAVAAKYGIPVDDVKRRIASVLDQVAENQGRRKGAAKDEYEEDPAVAAWRGWVTNGGM